MARLTANPSVALSLIATIAGAMGYAESMVAVSAASTALAADALIFLQHAFGAVLALWAALGTFPHRAWRARVVGAVIMALGGLVFYVAIRRMVAGSMPSADIMAVFALAAIVLAVVMAALFVSYRRASMSLDALWAACRNDVASHIFVLAGAGLVFVTRSNVADIAIGGVGAVFALLAGAQMLRTGTTAYDR